MSNLSNEAILALLADEEKKKAAPRGTRGLKVDPTLDRTIPTWTKLNHHGCNAKCEHRQQEGKLSPITQACWNPECVDTRRAADDLGRTIVVAIKGQYICRYCFLAGYLLEDE